MPSDAIVQTLIVAFFASLAPSIIAFATLMTSRNTNQKATEIKATGDKIHELTNSTLSNMTEQRNVMAAKVDGLERMLQQLTADKLLADHVAAEIARQTAITIQLAAASTPPPPPAAPAALSPGEVVDTLLGKP
jgi:hypothetical protein